MASLIRPYNLQLASFQFPLPSCRQRWLKCLRLLHQNQNKQSNNNNNHKIRLFKVDAHKVTQYIWFEWICVAIRCFRYNAALFIPSYTHVHAHVLIIHVFLCSVCKVCLTQDITNRVAIRVTLKNRRCRRHRHRRRRCFCCSICICIGFVAFKHLFDVW